MHASYSLAQQKKMLAQDSLLQQSRQRTTGNELALAPQKGTYSASFTGRQPALLFVFAARVCVYLQEGLLSWMYFLIAA